MEMEEYLGLMRHENQSFEDVEDLLELLREDKAVIDMRGLEAAKQIGEVREMLDKYRITEVSLSDDECPVRLLSITHNFAHHPHHGLIRGLYTPPPIPIRLRSESEFSDRIPGNPTIFRLKYFASQIYMKWQVLSKFCPNSVQLSPIRIS